MSRIFREIFCGHFPWKLQDENLRKISPKFRRISRRSLTNISRELRSGGVRAQTTPLKNPVAPVSLQLSVSSQVKLPLKRCRATGGCSSYTCGCRATLCNFVLRPHWPATEQRNPKIHKIFSWRKLAKNRNFLCFAYFRAFLNLGSMFCHSVLFTKTTGITKMTKMTKTTQAATCKGVDCWIYGNCGKHGNDENHENPGCKTWIPQNLGLEKPDLSPQIFLFFFCFSS